MSTAGQISPTTHAQARGPRPAAAPDQAARFARRLALVLTAASIGIGIALALHGWDYYKLPLGKRMHSPLHDELKPGGTLGRKLGIAGTALILLNLAYMLRRRVKRLQHVGSARTWLEVHIFCGLTGPLILVFHSAFLTNNLVAVVTAWSTLIVVLAGVAGRYMYSQLPRNIYGKEISLADLREEQRAVLDDLGRLLPPGSDAAAEVARFVLPAPTEKRGAPRLLLASLRADAHRLFESARMARRLRGMGIARADAAAAARATRRAAALGLRVTQLAAFQRVLARWRGVHLRLAIVMVVAMVVHVAVVTVLGYGLL